MTIPIDPETKVGDLLDSYPEAERLLIDLAPPFKALRNPVLRRTVARVTSLEQAARVGGVEVADLVMSLRRELGIGGGEVADDHGGGGGVEPPWVTAGSPSAILDADEILADGTTPLTEVNQKLAELDPGEVLCVKSSFQPAPLIDALRDRGVDVFCRSTGNDTWELWTRGQ